MMEKLAHLARQHSLLDLSQDELDTLKTGDVMIGGDGATFYVRSLYRLGPALLAMTRVPGDLVGTPSVTGPAGAVDAPQRRLVVISREPVRLGFDGVTTKHGGLYVQEVVPSAFALSALWENLSWTKPVSLRERRTTIGMGDRVGLATVGHIRSVRKFNVAPVLAQQSMRELAFTGRSFADVVADAAFLVFQEGYEDGFGADGDHLKTIPDIDQALKRGMPMITLDLTEVMRPEVANWSETEVNDAFARLPSDFRSRVDAEYAGKTLRAGSAGIAYDEELARRCAVMYGRALSHAEDVNSHLDRMTGGAYDLEISIDETTTPTLPSHHLFIARELERRGVTVNSVAPRFIGEFQKGVDYIGDLAEFEEQFKVHAEIARSTGGYKVSVHSGSDKFTPYPVIGRETQLRLHLKTAGTSWLESLRAISKTEPGLYRLIHQRAFDYFPEALKSYHITADIGSIRPLEACPDEELPLYLQDNNCRQLLHISYGGLLRDPEIREPYYRALHVHEEIHNACIEAHMDKHLETLGVDRR